MFSLLALPSPLEHQFWNHATTQSNIVRLDRWGLATGILTNSVIAKFFSKRAASTPFVLRATLVLFFVLQCLQLAALLTKRCRKTYLDQRLRLTLLHRTMRLLQHCYTIILVPMAQSYSFAVSNDGTGHTGSWRPYFITLLTLPTLALLHAINHPLPMALQLSFVLTRTALDLAITLPDAAVMIKQLGFVDKAQTTCHALDNTVGLLVNVVPPHPVTGDSLACGPYKTEFALAFCYVSIAILLPLHLTYWYERHCKAAFLVAQRQHQDFADDSLQQPAPKVVLSAVTPTTRFACVLVSVMAAWWLCILYAPLCAWLQ